MRKLKLLALTACLLAATTTASSAAFINGSIGFAGVFAVVDSGGTEVPFPAATAIDFAPAGGGSGNFILFTRTGDLAVIPVFSIGTIQDVSFAPFAGPIANFFTVGGLSFDLNSLAATTQSAISLVLAGQGVLRLAGFDDTQGAFTFSGQTDGVNPTGGFTFTFSGGAAAIPEPASLALLGTALLGLGLGRRSRRPGGAA